MESATYPAASTSQAVLREAGVAHDESTSLAVLGDACVTLRPLEHRDAPALFAMLTTDEVTRFISPPPPDVAGFEAFIQSARRDFATGRHVVFGIVPAGYDVPVGVVQVRLTDPASATAEWGIALGSAFWGTGLFPAAARLFIDFIFTTLGVRRLEGRAAVQNGRANGALRKLGAVQEGLLRRSLVCNGRCYDQLLWSILAEDWRESRAVPKPMVH